MSRLPVVMAIALALAGCKAEAPSPASSAPAQPPPTTATSSIPVPDVRLADEIVAHLLKEEYGGQPDSSGGCTPYVWQSDAGEVRYCMQAAEPEIVPVGTAYDLYVRTFSRLDAEGSDAYDAITPGLMGAFRVRVDPDGQWRVLDAAKAMAFGTMGFCGCDRAAFVRLGPERYGWMFTSGGTWQGVTVTSHDIVAPRDGGFIDLSAIPEIREDAQDTTYSIRVLEGQSDQQLWPLEVSKKVAGRPPELRRVSIDAETGLYRLPDGF